MTNLHGSYLAGVGFDITTPGLKTDYGSAALQTALPGQVNMHKCMYMCVRPRVCVCLCVCVLSVCACMWATDGLTEDGGIGGFKCVHVCVRHCVRMCATLPAFLRLCVRG